MSVDLLSLDVIDKKFPHEQQKVFNQISFQFQSNRSYALMGQSGIGKSTLLAMIAGMQDPDSGSITINQQKIKSKEVGMICQQPLLISELCVLENVLLCAIIEERLNQKIIDYALTLLNFVGLGCKKDQLVHTLSGGQQQKIAILRSMVYPPKFLLADEPTGNLDRDSANQIMQLLLHYHQQNNMGLIVSTHDIFVAKQCDVIVRIENQILTT